ncbi:MAG: uracil-DNA glycosylase family protein [Rhodospirillales bacterium]|nr:uracil-DNA glycosylase family protein [Rhodospirillales bacterium]
MALQKNNLHDLLKEVRACEFCAPDLPLGPRPTVVAKSSAKIMIIGQAPGTKVHETGIPWNDPSGDRLRNWLSVTREIFYDGSKIAIMPMGFCYPGRLERGGDNPPRPECAPAWHEKILAGLPDIELTLLVGMYAQKYYLAEQNKKTLTETVRHWQEFAPAMIPTPHPSWRTTAWLKKNLWFEAELLPVLQQKVRKLLEG